MTFLAVYGGGNDGATATGTSMTMTVPVGVSNGDVAFIAATVGSTSTTLTTPTGYTLVSGPDDETAGLRCYLFKKQLTAAEAGTTVTLTASGTARLSGAGIVFTGVDYATVGTAVKTLSGNTSITMPSVTTTAVNADVAEFYLFSAGTGAPPAVTFPGTPTPTMDDQNNTAFTSGNRYAVAVAHFPEGAVGAKGGGTMLPAGAIVQLAYGISVNPTAAANTAPTANAGADQTGVEPYATVTLDGSGSSDSDGTVASYAWTQTGGTTVSMSSSTAQKPTFTAPATVAGSTLTFSLVVTDDDGAASSADTVSITVLPHTVFRLDAGGPTPVKVTRL